MFYHDKTSKCVNKFFLSISLWFQLLPSLFFLYALYESHLCICNLNGAFSKATADMKIGFR